jgi:DNA polymerase-1
MLAVLHFLGVNSKSTDSKELKRDYKQNPFVRLLIDYREWNKKLTSFGENFLKKINATTNKIHAQFNQVGTGTGRLSSDDPNLQNIDADLGYRACFIAEPGYLFLTSDYSQIELRLAAELSQDPIMIKAYLDRDDLHAITASSVFEVPRDQLTEEIRRKGKSFNFAILYGTTARGLAYNFGIKEEEATRRLEIFYNTYSELARFIRGTQSQIITRGYSITPLGRKRFFIIPNKWTNSNFKLMYRVFREGFNHIIQGGSADMTKIAMCDIYYDNPFGSDLRLKLTEHDEIVTMAKKEIINDAKIFVEEKMLNAAKLVIKTIPVEVKTVIAPYWSKGDK